MAKYISESSILDYGGCVPGACRVVDDVLYVGLEMNDMDSNKYIARLYKYDVDLNRQSAVTAFTGNDMLQVCGIYGESLDVSAYDDSYQRVASISGIPERIELVITTQDGYAVVTSDNFYHFDGTTLLTLVTDVDTYYGHYGCDSYNGMGAYSSYCYGTYTLTTLNGIVIKSCPASMGGFVLIKDSSIYASYCDSNSDTIIIKATLLGEIESETTIAFSPVGQCMAAASSGNIVVSSYNMRYESYGVYVYNSDFTDRTRISGGSARRLPFVGISTDNVFVVGTSDEVITTIGSYAKVYDDKPDEPGEVIYGTVNMETRRVKSANPVLIFNYKLDVANYSGPVYFKCTIYSDPELTQEVFSCDSATSPGLFDFLGNNRVALYCSPGPVRDIYAVIQIGIEGVAP